MPLLSGQLYGVSPLDPATFVAAPALLLVVAIVASYLPARRATSTSPVEALRLE
jgi:ABC-type lipoprotein release transport system permease subunit